MVVSIFPHERWRQETQELLFKSRLGYMRPRDKVKLEKKGRDEKRRERKEEETRQTSPHETMSVLQQIQ